jgi:uncharacterized membrane protein required for colicin V production
MADVIIVLLLGGAFLLGFFQGVIRGLLAIAAWFVAFVLAANLRAPVGDWLSDQWLQYTPAYNAMLAFGAVALVLFVTAIIVIQVGTRGVATLSRYPLLDDVIGGLLGVALAFLLLAALIVVLMSFYAAGPTPGAVENTEWTADLYRTLENSAIGRLIRDSLVPGLGAALNVLLPGDIRNVMS